MELNIEKLGVWAGIAALALGVYLGVKQNRIAGSIGIAVDDLSKRTSVEIEKDMVQQAVRDAVNRDVATAVHRASALAVQKVADDIHGQVKDAVKASYGDLRESVSRKISGQVSNINMKALTDDVTEKAKAAILEKFDGSLDDVLSEFNKNLNNVSKIYESIAGTVSKKREKEYIFGIPWQM